MKPTLKTPARLVVFCLALLFVGEASAQSVPVLSRNQVTLINGIQKLISIRVEPRRSPLATAIAGAVEDDMVRFVRTYFPDTPYLLPKSDDIGRRNEAGRIYCRLLAAERGTDVAVHTRCVMGNLLVNIMNREDLLLVPRQDAIPEARAMIENAIRRLAFSYRKARGRQPVWIPTPGQARRELQGTPLQ